MPPKTEWQKKVRLLLYDYLDKMQREEKTEFLLLSKKWGVVEKELSGKIEDLSKLEDLTKSQLFRLGKYQTFLADSKNLIKKFNGEVEEIIKAKQLDFAEYGLAVIQNSLDLLGVNFNKLNINQTNTFIGISQTGSPLYTLLEKSYPETTINLTDTLLKSIALGRNPIETARLMKCIKRGKPHSKTE